MNIIGRLTKDAQVRTVSQERKVVGFSVAINDSYRNKQGERIEQTTYFDCSYWTNPNVAQILTKGTLVELTGNLTTNLWTTKEGEPRVGLNFFTATIKVHGGGKKLENIPTTTRLEQNSFEGQETTDLPF